MPRYIGGPVIEPEGPESDSVVAQWSVEAYDCKVIYTRVSNPYPMKDVHTYRCYVNDIRIGSVSGDVNPAEPAVTVIDAIDIVEEYLDRERGNTSFL